MAKIKILNIYNSALHSLLVTFWFFMHITLIYTMKIHFITLWWTKEFLHGRTYETPTLHAFSRGGSSLFVTDGSPFYGDVRWASTSAPSCLCCYRHLRNRQEVLGLLKISNVPSLYMQKHCDCPLLRESSISIISKRNTRPAGCQCFHFSILIQ
jgi:hypothetical protein